MDKSGVRPNSIIFSNMLTGFYREEKMDDIKKVLKLVDTYSMVSVGDGLIRLNTLVLVRIIFPQLSFSIRMVTMQVRQMNCMEIWQIT
ncbi:hypothetical protein SAY87_022066 [Trapa incisa]|uniref:Uncharacterized protein n=1 Tax=Trapa incisa TaxID=236973 RepID=A0AAN7JSS3_9MYRT|nr:hypothetical protein SAY87_022066 [Trapa incisa]